ncbi:MAG: crotonase/enoyl-CoA hydratase family protein [Pseudomonadota bacterium]
MLKYDPPIRDLQFLLHEVFEIAYLAELPSYADADPETVNAILYESAKLSKDVLSPLNRVGDAEGCELNPDGSVSTPTGFKQAYELYCQSGLPALNKPIDLGGQGLPFTVHMAVGEMISASNMAFALYPGLSGGAWNAISAAASIELKQRFLPKMTTGEWTGTMNLTEPHCGTDLGMIRTKAMLQQDGTFKLSGQKTWISGGDHDLAENIIHLVLARIEGAPDGVSGLSLFIVPKYLVKDDGSLGNRNGVNCGGLEQKMGIHGNATCVLNYEEASGYLVGEPNQGLSNMFVMMNEERIGSGMFGYAIGESAYQNALSFALERRQGRALQGAIEPKQPADPILVHPDVRRMLLDMRCYVESGRALGLWLAVQQDLEREAPDEETRLRATDFLALLTPVMKAYFTEKGLSTAIQGQQVMGGSGFCEEWGMSQLVRDIRITSIWEGTNGVQALDLVGRKLPAYGGRLWKRYFEDLTQLASACDGEESLSGYVEALLGCKADLLAATEWLAVAGMENPNNAASVSKDYLELFGLTCMSHMWLLMARTALAECESQDFFYARKLTTGQYFLDHIVPQAGALRAKIANGPRAIVSMDNTFWPLETGKLSTLAEDYRMKQEAANQRGTVRSERHDRVLKIIIDNPSKKNSFVPEMMLELSNALTELDNDSELWVGVLCAEGEHFTAGLDMPKFFGPGATEEKLPENNVDPFGLGKICSKPIVTAVQGITYTVGIEMMLAGDLVVAADSTRFCQMESKRGIAPLGGGHFRYITRAGWGNAMYHLLLCDEFNADQAHRIGLVQEVVPHGTQVERAMELANIISKNAPLGIQVTKKAARAYIEHGEQAAIDIVPEIHKQVMSSEDMMEGIQSFIERREAEFKGR